MTCNMLILSQDQNPLTNSSFNGVSVTAELPKLSLRDAPDDNSYSTVSSPAPGPLSSPLGMSEDLGDLHEVPINDEATGQSLKQSQSLEEVINLIL